MKKIELLILTAVLFTACHHKSTNYISTGEALIKYENVLSNKPFIVFTEIRDNPLKWFDSIPETRIREYVQSRRVKLNARPGEFYVFQLGVWASARDLNGLQIEFTDFTGRSGKKIAASRITCFNQGGRDFRGIPFLKILNIPAGRLQPLWLGIDLDGIATGTYKGSVSLSAAKEKQTTQIELRVAGDPAPNHGYDEGASLSRLNWLNSTAGIDDEVTKGFVPVSMDNRRISILGREITISETGLPASVVSFFDSSNQSVTGTGAYVVRKPFRFIIERETGGVIKLAPGDIEFTGRTDAGVNWKVTSTSEEADIQLNGHLEFDGFVDYSLKIIARKSFRVKDIRLEIPVAEEKAEYMMGLGHEGGYRAPDWKWKWDVTKNQDMLWVGSVNGGLRVKWKADNYVRPLINVYYKFGPLNLPASWGNEGKGGVDIAERNSDVVINAYSGSREIKEGDVLNYNFELLITPFRPIDRKNKFGERYYHGGGVNTSVKVDNAIKAGANIINIHHAEDIYPFINYPYLDENVADLAGLVSDAHEKEIRMKFYYTTRELTKNLPEFWPFYSLNGEVIFPGPGNNSRTVINPEGPNEWLVKNLREKYIPAWHNPVTEGRFRGEIDVSVITTPDSRLNNFYVAGLEWMVKNIGIDGVYIDDSALDRYTLQRARKVIDRHRPEGRMDLHSWNHFNEWAGYTNCLNLYMDLLPYFDLVWIGEGRDYDRSPDHWLTEVSGIPFGLPGQMLEGGGNPWRGMVYGITNRAGWVGNTPIEIWKFWDDYKIADKVLIGYWEKNYPVKCSNSNIKTSLFKGDDETILSVANWSDRDQTVSLNVNWKDLHIDPSSYDIFMPGIKEFQEARNPVSLSDISVPGKKGFLIVLKSKIK